MVRVIKRNTEVGTVPHLLCPVAASGGLREEAWLGGPGGIIEDSLGREAGAPVLEPSPAANKGHISRKLDQK